MKYSRELFNKERTDRFWSNVGPPNEDGCTEWQRYKSRKGYGYVGFRHDKVILEWRAHRYAWVCAYGLIPDGKHILHRCDNPPCCNPEHLFVGDYQINRADCVAKGRQAKGESIAASKLTEKQVLAIFFECAGMTAREVMKTLKLKIKSEASVHNVRAGKTWGHLTGPCFRAPGVYEPSSTATVPVNW